MRWWHLLGYLLQISASQALLSTPDKAVVVARPGGEVVIPEFVIAAKKPTVPYTSRPAKKMSFTETEGTFKVPDGGPELYTKTWMPAKPIAKLAFFHGFSDHVGRYYGLFPALASRGVAVYGFDQRGWGRSVRSPRERGVTGLTQTVLSDMVHFLRHVLAADAAGGGAALPLFVMGHSMGGGEVLTLASTADPTYIRDVVRHVRGWVLESAFVAFPPADTPSQLKIMVGKMAGALMPHYQLKFPIPPERLSRDPEVQESIRNDELLPELGTLEGLAGLLQRTDDLASGRAKLCAEAPPKSLFMAHGTEDMVTDYYAAKRWFDRWATTTRTKGKDGKVAETPAVLADATFHTYEGCYHQLHSDLERDRFYKDVADWVVARCGGAETAASKPPVVVEAKVESGAKAPVAAAAEAKL